MAGASATAIRAGRCRDLSLHGYRSAIRTILTRAVTLRLGEQKLASKTTVIAYKLIYWHNYFFFSNAKLSSRLSCRIAEYSAPMIKIFAE